MLRIGQAVRINVRGDNAAKPMWKFHGKRAVIKTRQPRGTEAYYTLKGVTSDYGKPYFFTDKMLEPVEE